MLASRATVIIPFDDRVIFVRSLNCTEFSSIGKRSEGWDPGWASSRRRCRPDEGWIPQQRIDLETAIRGYTINGAYANFVEQNRGSITVGKYADIIMLSDNLFEIPAAKIKDAHVLLTLVAGKTVYRAPQ